MRREITVQRFEVGVRALTRHEAELHQFAGRIVDAGSRGRLEADVSPAVLQSPASARSRRIWF